MQEAQWREVCHVVDSGCLYRIVTLIDPLALAFSFFVLE